MKIDNKIGYLFGKAARFTGIIFIFLVIFSLIQGDWGIALLVLVIVAFVLFSYSGVDINTEKRQVRQYKRLFGFIKTGEWKSIQPYLGVTLIPFTRKESMASWSNRTNTVKETDYRIYLVNAARKPAFAIKRCNNLEQAQDSIDEFSIWLKLPVFSVKR
ncbi:MAG: hypothetical protein ACOCWD_03800 [Tangfeifania sp.]